MSKKFEAGVKPSKEKSPDSDEDQKRNQDRDLEGTDDERSTPSEEREQSPLKTVGGTPIIERTPG